MWYHFRIEVHADMWKTLHILQTVDIQIKIEWLCVVVINFQGSHHGKVSFDKMFKPVTLSHKNMQTAEVINVTLRELFQSVAV
jgi:hypothetical protein